MRRHHFNPSDHTSPPDARPLKMPSIDVGAVVVRYTATESGGTHPLELPDPITAYLTMGDVEAGTP